MRPPNSASVAYAPEDPPSDPKLLPRYLSNEFTKIQTAINALAVGHIDKSYVSPGKPRDGDIRYADGTSWNPGSGIGLYQFDGTNWIPLSNPFGLYTPTLYNVTNIDASTAYQAHWCRVGNVVIVAGVIDVDPTANILTELGFSLPIATDFSSAIECSGTATSKAISGQSAAILGDVANNRASMQWKAADHDNQSMAYIFTYRII